MAVRIPSDQLMNPQSLEIEVSGPDGANRLFVRTGLVPVAFTGVESLSRQTFTWLLGRQLTRRQFIGATAHVSISHLMVSGEAHVWVVQLELADADWDDETQQVECRAELSGQARSPVGQVSILASRLSYQVTVLAEIAFLVWRSPLC